MLAPIAHKAAISPINIDRLRQPGHQRKLPTSPQDTIEISQEAREMAGTAKSGQGPSTHEPAPPAPLPLVPDSNPLPPLKDATRVNEADHIQESGLQRPLDAARSNAESQDRLSETTGFTEEEKAEIRKLERRDREVRAHENAHINAAGGHAVGQPNYQMQSGPNGRQYAVGGHVRIDITPVQGDPEATAAKMRSVRRAAMAPADPSAQDHRVASEATRIEREALTEISKENAKEAGQAQDTSTRTPESDRHKNASSTQETDAAQASEQDQQFPLRANPRAAMAHNALLEAIDPKPISSESSINAQDLAPPG